MTRRSRLEIISDILVSIRDKQGRIKPTHLLYKSNLSHKKMTEYLEELITKEMVKEEHVNNYKYILITDKGLGFLSEIKRIEEFTESFGL
ncbi:MAG: winged helix-turn-helix domain-containing protein [Nanoarchaeota archaeon]